MSGSSGEKPAQMASTQQEGTQPTPEGKLGAQSEQARQEDEQPASARRAGEQLAYPPAQQGDAKLVSPRPRVAALLPIAVFLMFYLGCGVYFEYVNPTPGQMGFYVVSVVVAFSIALIVAFLQNRALSFDKKIHACAQGIGDDNIVIMLFIFLMAGAFSGIASAAGGASSTANMLLNVIPANLVVPGFFLIACVISLAMGTSVGTITVLTPIAVTVVAQAGLSLPLCLGAVVGGAMFGDNLSFISDTTIAATRTQGVLMKDKFRTNFAIAAPAAVVALVIFGAISISGTPAEVGTFDFNVWQALPYFVVLIVAIAGVNVFVVLGGGIVLFGIVGAATGSLTFESAFLAMGTGTSGMFETMIVAILVAAISALVREYGGFAAVLAFIRRTFQGRRGGMLGIGLLTALMDIATANNTVAIVMAGPIAKEIATEYDIEPRRTASYMDLFSCVMQGIIPYGAQLLVASSLAGITATSIVPYSIYQVFVLVAALVSIALAGRWRK